MSENYYAITMQQVHTEYNYNTTLNCNHKNNHNLHFHEQIVFEKYFF